MESSSSSLSSSVSSSLGEVADLLASLGASENVGGLLEELSVATKRIEEMGDMFSLVKDTVNSLSSPLVGISQELLALSEEGGLQFAPITVDGKVEEVPPFGSPSLTAGERQGRVKSIASRHPGSGSSMFIDIFADHILACYKDCLKDGRMRSHLNQEMWVKMDAASSETFRQRRRDLLAQVLGIIYRCIGGIEAGVRYLNNQDNSIRTKINHNSPEELQKGIVPQFERLQLSLDLLDIERFPAGKQLLDCIALFQDLVLQEMHTLAVVQNPYPNDLESVLKQMTTRLDRFHYLIENFASWQQPSFSIYRKEMSKELEETKKEWMDTCNNLKGIISEIFSGSSDRPRLIARLYESCAEAKGRLHMGTPFTLKAANDFLPFKEAALRNELDEEGVERVFLVGWGKMLDSSLSTTFFETILACFVCLDREKVLHEGDIRDSLEKVEKILLMQDSQALDSIQTTVERLETTIGPEDEEHFSIVKESTPVWRLIGRCQEALRGTIGVHLERLKRDDVQPADRGRALRDASTVSRLMYKPVSDAISKYRIGCKMFQGDCENQELLELNTMIIRKFEFYLQSFGVVLRDIDLLMEDSFESVLEAHLLVENAAAQSLEAREQAALKVQKELIEGEPKRKASKSSGGKKAKGKKGKRGKKPQRSKSKPKAKELPKKPLTPAPSYWAQMTSHTAGSSAASTARLTDLVAVEPEISTNVFERISQLKAKVIELPVDDDPWRKSWKLSTLENLELFLDQLGEYQRSKRTASVDLIHGEIDLVRRILEMGVKCTLALYPCIKDEHHLLDSVDVSLSHNLNQLVHLLLTTDSGIVPENVKKVLFHGRHLWTAFSQANSCINYPSSSSHRIVEPHARSLLDHLSRCASHAEEFNMKEHDQLIQMGLQVIEKLMHAVVDPAYGNELEGAKELPVSLDVQEDPIFGHLASAGEIKLQPAAAAAAMQSNFFTVLDRPQALQAIDEMVQWIQLRQLSEAHGRIDRRFRTQLRNQALEHVRLYLMRVRDKLNDPHRLSKSSVGVEEIALARRLLKEVSVAGLLHEEIYPGPDHIVRGSQLRYHNDPCDLNRVFRFHSQAKEKLPDLSEDRFFWLHSAHRLTSHPIELPIHEANGHKKNGLESDIRRYVALNQETKKLGAVEEGFTISTGSGSNLSHEQHAEKAESFIHEMESKYLFPALEATFQTLMNMPL